MVFLRPLCFYARITARKTSAVQSGKTFVHYSKGAVVLLEDAPEKITALLFY